MYYDVVRVMIRVVVVRFCWDIFGLRLVCLYCGCDVYDCVCVVWVCVIVYFLFVM